MMIRRSLSTQNLHALQLSAGLTRLLEQMRARRGFDAASWIDGKVDKFLDYMRQSGLRGCVLNLSGGVDSAVTLGLCRRAQDKDPRTLQRVVAVAQPIHSTPSIQDRAYTVAKAFGSEIITVDQSDLHTAVAGRVEEALAATGGSGGRLDAEPVFARGQLRSYMRTPVAYYVAQLLAAQSVPAVVMGTGNYDEDGFLYYFCKAGDGVVDVALIGDLHKHEVRLVGRELGVPEEVLCAPPSADLWDGQTDEGELGISYDFVELYTEYRKLGLLERSFFEQEIAPEDRPLWDLMSRIALSVHRRNAHKVNFPVNL